MHRIGLATAFVLTLFIALLSPLRAHAAGWSGWARCELNIVGPGYENRETHTWYVTDIMGNTPAMAGSGTWSVAGRGQLDQGNPAQTSQHAEWSINGSSSAARTGAEPAIAVAPSTSMPAAQPRKTLLERMMLIRNRTLEAVELSRLLRRIRALLRRGSLQESHTTGQ